MATKDGRKTGGRAKGTSNKATEEARDILARMNFKPLEAMVHWARGDWQALGLAGPTKTISIGEGQTLEVDRIDEVLRQKSTKEILPYVYPQLKAVDLSGEGMKDALALSFTALMAQAADDAKDPSAS